MYNCIYSQVFDVDTIQYNGNTNKYINIIIMGDGYTSTQQATFISDAINLNNHLFLQVPFSNYKNYFNVFAIKVISTDSGARHPNTAIDCSSASPLVPVSNPNTYLGCTFDYNGMHRLVVPTNNLNIASVLANNFPNYDQLLIISNSPYYGGSGGNYATSTTNSSSPEISAHEIGHSFSYLADEYYAGDYYAGEKVNMTKETDPALIKWKNWMSYNGIGIYQHCCVENSALWYKPHTNCKMQYLGNPYCSVCTQAIVEKIHDLVNPIVNYTPTNSTTINTSNQYIDLKLTELMKPIPNTLKIEWKLDASTISLNTDSVKIDQNSLTNGSHIVSVNVTDTSTLVRIDNHAAIHLSTVTWTINKTATNIKLTSTDNQFSFSVFPNPATNIFNISVQTEKQTNLETKIVSMNGKTVRKTDKMLIEGKYTNSIDIEDLSIGAYFVIIKLGDTVHTETLIKD